MKKITVLKEYRHDKNQLEEEIINSGHNLEKLNTSTAKMVVYSTDVTSDVVLIDAYHPECLTKDHKSIFWQDLIQTWSLIIDPDMGLGESGRKWFGEDLIAAITKIDCYKKIKDFVTARENLVAHVIVEFDCSLIERPKSVFLYYSKKSILSNSDIMQVKHSKNKI